MSAHLSASYPIPHLSISSAIKPSMPLTLHSSHPLIHFSIHLSTPQSVPPYTHPFIHPAIPLYLFIHQLIPPSLSSFLCLSVHPTEQSCGLFHPLVSLSLHHQFIALNWDSSVPPSSSIHHLFMLLFTQTTVSCPPSVHSFLLHLSVYIHPSVRLSIRPAFLHSLSSVCPSITLVIIGPNHTFIDPFLHPSPNLFIPPSSHDLQVPFHIFSVLNIKPCQSCVIVTATAKNKNLSAPRSFPLSPTLPFIPKVSLTFSSPSSV